MLTAEAHHLGPPPSLAPRPLLNTRCKELSLQSLKVLLSFASLRDDVPHIGINFDNHPPDFPETLREFLSDMSSVTTPPYTVHDHVALIRMSNPPINGLGHALRKLI